MTRSVSYCSLEEAWGDNYVESKENTPEKVKPNKDVSYSGGTQFSTDLLPQTHQDVYEDTIPSNTDMREPSQNNKDKYAIVPYNMDKEELWGEFLEYVSRKKEADQQQQQQQQHQLYPGNKSMGAEGFASFNSRPGELKKDNSYVDLLILIMFGIIIIFILDSFVRFGRKSKRD